MALKYSRKTEGFYQDDLVYPNLPDDLVSVSDETRRCLMVAQEKGAKITSDENGFPIAIENGGRGSVIDLSLVDTMDHTIPPDSLSIQAAHALMLARTHVMHTYTMLNEPTANEWVNYLKALSAIETGSDTTSTTLPPSPDESK